MTDPSQTTGIGFIGLGVMGMGMASRLLSENIAGSTSQPLIVWNRTSSKCTELQAKFVDKTVVVKTTAREVVESCSLVYCMLSTPEASAQVFDGDDGVVAGVHDQTSIVDCATLAESDMIRMHNAVTSKGGRFLEAPVSGSKVPAAMGALIFLCAGSQPLFDEIKGTGLTAMGKASHYFGNIGYGTRAKLVVNSLMGTMLAALGEGLALSESVGLDPSTMLEVIGQGAIQSPIYGLKGPKMIEGDYAPNFALKHAHKDMKLACNMAQTAGVEFSIMEAAEKIYGEAKDDSALNIAEEDFSAVYEIIHKKSSSDFSMQRTAEKNN
jgi:3-hydroxyisobutyrate dehydrogenase-like beta-hydroxyacid dehydrogenase